MYLVTVRHEPPKQPSSRGAFTLPEILIALLILAILTATVVPVVKGRLDRAEAAALTDNFNNMRRAILAYRDNVGRYPGDLRQLESKPGTGGAPTTDVCAGTIPTSAINAWRGPYLAQRSTSSGFQAGSSMILNALARSPATASTTPEGYLRIRVVEVVQSIAQDVDRAFDGGTLDLATGGITWVDAPGAALDTLIFHMALRNC